MSGPMNEDYIKAFEKLNKILDGLFEEMKRSGQLAGDAVTNKKEILQQLTTRLLENPDIRASLNNPAFTPENIKKDPALTNTFKLAIISETAATLTKNPEMKNEMRLDYKTLFDSPLKNKKDGKNEQEEALKEEFLELFKRMKPNELEVKGKDNQEKEGNEKGIADVLTRFVLDLKKKKSNSLNKSNSKDDKSAKKEAESEACRALMLSICALYGSSPNGNMIGPIQAIMGNPSGMIDISIGRDGSFFSEQNEAQFGKADPSGMEQQAIDNLVGEGGDLVRALQDAVAGTPQQEYKPRSPFTIGETPRNTR